MRLIDADLFEVFAYDERGNEFDSPREAYDQGVMLVLEKIDAAPTVDAQEVKHGRWIATGTYDNHKQPIYICTNCNREVADYFIDRHAFCLFCGAKMDTKD